MEEETLSSILNNTKTKRFRIRISLFEEKIINLLEKGKGKYIIQYFLETKPAISAQNFGSSALERKNVTKAHKQVVQLFVNSAGNCYFSSDRKPTILHYASKYGWLDIVQSLLQKGSDPNVKDFYGDTPLMFAMLSLHKDVVELLIESGADVLCRSNVNYTLLHAASEKGWFEFVQMLLNKGVDPNSATKRGFTPLDLAVRGPNKDLVSLLIDSGANIGSCKQKLGTMLRYAARGHIQVLRYLIEKTDSKQFQLIFPMIFHVACTYEQIEIIELLIKVLNGTTGRSDTPLICIISRFRNSLKLVKLFIERGAYFSDYCYNLAVINDTLNVGILQNVQVCTQAIINKFNNKDLPDLYKLPVSAEMLPPIEILSIKSPGIIRGIQESVRREIVTRGYCNVMEPKAIALSMMAVKSYIGYCDGLKRMSQLQRSTVDSEDHSYSVRETRCLDFSPIEIRYFNLRYVENLLEQW